MIDNETLLGFALSGLEPAESDAVRAALPDDAAASLNLARIRAILQPLEADREAPRPPPDLIAQALARLEASLAMPKPRTLMLGRWIEMGVAASIGLLAFGLVATGVNKWHEEARREACADNLRRIYTGLDQYADNYDNHYPQVGVGTAPKAGDFHAIMANDGTWPHPVEPRCIGPEPVGYSYSLGYRDAEGRLVGPQRNCEHPAQMPIVGDLPGSTLNLEGPVSPHAYGHNVLFTDGHAIFSRSANLGPNGDHIYLNQDHLPRAGLHANDAVLGWPGSEP